MQTCTRIYYSNVLLIAQYVSSDTPLKNCNCSLWFHIHLWLPAVNSCRQTQTSKKLHFSMINYINILLSPFLSSTCFLRYLQHLIHTHTFIEYFVHTTRLAHTLHLITLLCTSLYKNLKKKNCNIHEDCLSFQKSGEQVLLYKIFEGLFYCHMCQKYLQNIKFGTNLRSCC
jgi:hypothetical protein